MIETTYFLYIAAALFALGFSILISKRNLIMMLMGVELMLNAVNINFVALAREQGSPFEGQLFSLFIMIVAAAEVAVALAIILKIRAHYNTIDPDEIKELKN